MPRLRRMDRQVVRSPIGASDTLGPASGVLNLGVPAVRCVVGHLIRHVLPEAQALGINADLEQKELHPGEEVAQRLVGDDAFLNSLSNLHVRDLRATADLDVPIEQRKLSITHLIESLVILVFRIDVVLDFGHCELAHAKETCTGGDLIAEGLADVGRCERHAPVVELEQARKVQEVPLSGLWSQIPDRQLILEISKTKRID